MSPEEWQVALGEWVTMIGAAADVLWEMPKEDLDPGHVDGMARVATTLSKVIRDMMALQWSDADRDHAFTVIAGYVTQSNVERQKRRDDDLANHKRMIEKEAEKRITDGLREASKEAAEALRRADAAERQSRAEIAYAIEKVETEIDRRTAVLENTFEARVKEEVERRLMGGSVSATPGRTKRPVIIG